MLRLISKIAIVFILVCHLMNSFICIFTFSILYWFVHIIHIIPIDFSSIFVEGIKPKNQTDIQTGYIRNVILCEWSSDIQWNAVFQEREQHFNIQWMVDWVTLYKKSVTTRVEYMRFLSYAEITFRLSRFSLFQATNSLFLFNSIPLFLL